MNVPTIRSYPNSQGWRLVAAYCLLIAASCPAAVAQEPHVVNARMRSVSAAAGLAIAFHSILSSEAGPAWVGYAVPVVPGNHQMCCNVLVSEFSENGCGRCRLEGRDGEEGGQAVNRGGERTVKLEAPPNFLVLYRVAAGKVEKIRTFSLECELDAGGLPLIWLTEVRPADSVAWLSSFAKAGQAGVEGEGESGEDDHLSSAAVTAVAFHADNAAERALEGFVASGQPARLREHAAFWLGEARGQQGYETLKRLAQSDPDDHFREKVVFDLYVSQEPGAVDSIIAVAHHDSSARVRGQALFWLAQKAGKKAEATISEAIANDPETEVKKHAVFALSQLPKDEGVPLLIQVAKTNTNGAVRKQAMFWLGQSRDPRALAFFEEVLSH